MATGKKVKICARKDNILKRVTGMSKSGDGIYTVSFSVEPTFDMVRGLIY